jgi:hypothetical protein
MINYDEETNQYVNCVDPDVSIADAVNLVSWLIETHASRLRDRYIQSRFPPTKPRHGRSKLAEAKAEADRCCKPKPMLAAWICP